MRQNFLLALAATTIALVTSPAPAQSPTSVLLPQSSLLTYGLRRSWFAQVAIDPSRSRLANWVLAGERLIVQTTSNGVTALDAETGRRLWTVQVGRESSAPSRPAANDKYVAVVNGLTLHILDAVNGYELWNKRLDSAPLVGPAMNQEWVYVTTANAKLLAFNLEDPKDEPWMYGSAGVIPYAPLATKQSVIWANNRGMLHACDFDRRSISFLFETDEPIVAPLSFRDPFVFLITRDRTLHAVETRRGSQLGKATWTLALNGEVNRAAVPIDNRLFVMQELGGMYAVQIMRPQTTVKRPELGAAVAEPAEPAAEPQDTGPKPVAVSGGTILWFTPRVTDFVSASPTRLYVADQSGQMLILNGRSGAPVGSLSTYNLPWKLSNIQNDRIYLASKTGFIQCLRERDLAEPHVHNQELPDEDDGGRRIIQQGAE